MMILDRPKMSIAQNDVQSDLLVDERITALYDQIKKLKLGQIQLPATAIASASTSSTGLRWKGIITAQGTSFAVGDVISYNGRLWICILANPGGILPGASPTSVYWAPTGNIQPPLAIGPNAVLGGQNYYDHLASGSAFAGETGTSQIDLGFQIAEGAEQNTYAKGLALSLINNPPSDIVIGPGQIALSVFSADDPTATHRCGQINAIYGAAAHLGSGLADVVEGLNFTAINQGPGPVTTLYGAFIGSANYGNDGVTLTGTVTAARSLNVQTPIAETGDITTGYGIYLEKPLFANSKTLSHLYGIYFEDMSNSSGGTNSDPWAIYESANNKNQLGQTTFIGLAGFSSGSGVAADAGISRSAAKSLYVGNGTQGDVTGTLSANTLVSNAGNSGLLATLRGFPGLPMSYAGLWFTNAGIVGGNYSIVGDGTNTYVNASTGGMLYFRNNNSTVATLDGNGLFKSVALVVTGATPTGSGSQVSFGTTTATNATAGTNGAIPSQVVGYLEIDIGGTKYKIPYFAV